MFFIIMSQTMANIMMTVTLFSGERPVFLREYASGLYGVLPYYKSKTLVEMPIAVLAPTVFLVLCYFSIGFDPDKFLYNWICILLIVQVAYSYGYFIASMFKKEESAVMAAPLIVMPLVLFAGQFSNTDTMPEWIGWIQWLSPIRYGLEVMIRNEFEGKLIDGRLDVVDYYGYRELNVEQCMFILLGLVLAFRLLAFIMLKLLVSKFQ